LPPPAPVLGSAMAFPSFPPALVHPQRYFIPQLKINLITSSLLLLLLFKKLVINLVTLKINQNKNK
jgi:hypothetical protein